jgi:serine protease Do
MQSCRFVALVKGCHAAVVLLVFFGRVVLAANSEESGSEMPEVVISSTPIDRAAGLAASYADVLEGVRGSVVSVYSSRILERANSGFPYNDPLFRRFFGRGAPDSEKQRQDGLGSGVIVSASGYILTNNHVVAGSDQIRVALADGREFTAQVVGGDPRTDVAVIKIEAEDLQPARLADSDLIRIGDIVFAVGNPLGIGQTTTMGIVSATGRANLGLINQGYEDFIQTDASINPGNSGGALVDAEGRVIGINTAIITTSMGNIGIGFAIPTNLAFNIMHSLIETGGVARGFLGVSLQDLDSDLSEAFGVGDSKGVLVVNVQPGSPADECGLERDDVITRVGSREVSSVAELRLAISQTTPGTVVTIGLLRDGKSMEVEATLAKLEEDTVFLETSSNELLGGIQVEPISPELVEIFQLREELRGVVVVEVDPSSQYAELLPVGTVVEQINRVAVSDAETGRQSLRQGRNLLLVNQQGIYKYLAINVK